MEFVEAHYASLLTFAYVGLGAWLANRVLHTVAVINGQDKIGETFRR